MFWPAGIKLSDLNSGKVDYDPFRSYKVSPCCPSRGALISASAAASPDSVAASNERLVRPCDSGCLRLQASKAALTLFSRELARRLSETQIKVIVADPGVCGDTGLFR